MSTHMRMMADTFHSVNTMMLKPKVTGKILLFLIKITDFDNITYIYQPLVFILN